MQLLLFLHGGLAAADSIYLLLHGQRGLGVAFTAGLGGILIAYGLWWDVLRSLLWPVILLGCILLYCLVGWLLLTCYGRCDTCSYEEKGVIVLGCGIRGEQISPSMARRLDCAVAYAENNPTAVIVVSGGLGHYATVTEAEAMRRCLTAAGIAEERIRAEEKSTNTVENLLYSRELLPEGRVVLITSDYHCWRAELLARRQGMDVCHLGAHENGIADWLPHVLREPLAIARMALRRIFTK